MFGGDGVVTKKYLKLSMLSSGQASSSEVQEMLDTLDTDNDGKVKLEDFMRSVKPGLRLKMKAFLYF